MREYKIFTRTWWIDTPGGLLPQPGRPYTIDYAENETEAMAICQEYNETHTPGKLSKKAEYTLNN